MAIFILGRRLLGKNLTNFNIKNAIGMVKIEIGIQIEIDTSNGKILKAKSQVKYLL